MRESFSAGACTWQKILLRLQVWNLSAISRQMMRAADCKELAESPEGDFRQAQRRHESVGVLLCIAVGFKHMPQDTGVHIGGGCEVQSCPQKADLNEQLRAEEPDD